MRKRIVCFTLAAAMLMSLAGCRSAEPAATEAATEASTAAEGGDSQGEAQEGGENQAEPRLRVMKKLPRQTP